MVIVVVLGSAAATVVAKDPARTVAPRSAALARRSVGCIRFPRLVGRVTTAGDWAWTGRLAADCRRDRASAPIESPAGARSRRPRAPSGRETRSAGLAG